MNASSAPASPRKRITLLEVAVVIVLIAILVALLEPFPSSPEYSHFLFRQANNGRMISNAMANYAGDGEYPLYRDKKDPTTKICESNAAFDILLEGGYLDDKKLLFQTNSPWCHKVADSQAKPKEVMPGENDWCYVAGLNHSTAKPDWPILANAFVPGTTYYTTDVAKKGGSYRGKKAVVVYCDGHTEIVRLPPKKDFTIVPRKDKRTEEDAFAPTTDWLTGPNVKVLYPK